MASEIRVNKITNRSGLSTVTFSDTGVIVSGIVTANSFSGGTINVTSGTITGNLGVGGILTYEDVTNIDSVGVITARSGIRIGATGSNTLITGNGTGIGIGITTPQEELHIRAATPVIRLEDGDNARQSQIVGSDGNLRFDADNNNAIANTNISFRTDGSERLRIKNDGKVNITPGGALSGNHPPGDLNIVGTNFLTMTPNDNANASDNEVLGHIAFLPYAAGTIAAASAKIEAVAESGQSGSANPTSLRFYTKASGSGPGSAPTEKVRIMGTSLPTLKVGSTTASSIHDQSGTGNEGAWLVAAAPSAFAVSNDLVCRMNRKSSNGIILQFRYNGSSVGSISTNSSSLPSDRNFKTNISNLNLGLSFVNKLKPSQFNYKIDEPNTPVMYGLIAQELEESLTSEGVSKNSTQLLQHHPTDDTESDYDVDYGKLTPILINAVKELSIEIETLKARINNLEGN